MPQSHVVVCFANGVSRRDSEKWRSGNCVSYSHTGQTAIETSHLEDWEVGLCAWQCQRGYIHNPSQRVIVKNLNDKIEKYTNTNAKLLYHTDERAPL